MAVGFELIRRLGAGHFGEVWLVHDTGLDAQRAVKFIPADKLVDPDNFFHEAQVLKASEHPNIVRVEETGRMDDGRIYIAMEYLPGGSIADEAEGAFVALTRVKRVMIGVLRGLEYAHSKGILHRDVKPANILIGANGEGKLSDFGLALPMGVELSASSFKDYAYLTHMAPELHRARKYTVATDVYSTGVTLYRLVNGDAYLPPPGTVDVPRLTSRGEFPDRSHYREFVPRPIRVLVNRAMNVDPALRFPSAEDLRRSLERTTIAKNWNEIPTPKGMMWNCSWDNMIYEVHRKRVSRGDWQLEVRKGRAKPKLRRIRKLCRYGMTKREAERHTRHVLQGFVLGKYT
jgi:serine/threonine protein kinase